MELGKTEVKLLRGRGLFLKSSTNNLGLSAVLPFGYALLKIRFQDISPRLDRRWVNLRQLLLFLD